MKSVPARFTFSFLANLLRSAVAFLTSLLLARAMGVTAFGNLQFLTGAALAVRQLLDMGSSNAFFTLIAQKQRGRRLIAAYFLWLAVQLGAILLFLAALSALGAWDRVWLGQPRAAVVLAVASAVAVDGVWGAVVNIGESIRKTHVVQTAGVAAALAFLAAAAVLRAAGLLDVPRVLWTTTALYLSLSAATLWRLVRRDGLIAVETGDDWSVGRIVSYFVSYCKPFLALVAVGFLYGFADDWLLQRYSGARQQAFLGVSQQISTVVLLTTTSFLKVFWKEVSEAAASGDVARAGDLYRKASRTFYFVSAAISAWMIPLSGPIIELTLGAQYRAAALPLSVALFFPIHQTLGQLNGTYYYASEDVETYARVGMLLMLVFLPVGYFILASRDAAVPGLGLGAAGVSLKLVVQQLIASNLNSWLITRKHGARYDWAYQFTSLGVLLAVSFAACGAAGAVVARAGWPRPEVLVLALSGLLYGAVLLVLLESRPTVFGLSREEYARIRARALSAWRPGLGTPEPAGS